MSRFLFLGEPMDVQAIESILEAGIPGCQLEVMADGNDEQKQTAQDLLGQLG